MKPKKLVFSHGTIRVIVLAIAIPVFIYSSWQLGSEWYSKYLDSLKIDEVQGQKSEAEKDPFADPGKVIVPKNDVPYVMTQGKDSYLNEDGILVEYEALRERNSDMVAWIRFPGFEPRAIDYPIMYSGDNDFYLNRDFDKIDSIGGSVFLDGANTPYNEDPTILDRNYVLYGHALRSNRMFGALDDYFENEESWENDTIYIDFMNTRLEYRVFSTFICDPLFNYRQTEFSSDEEYQTYLDTMLAKSTHDFGVDVTYKDKIITLSTCYNHTRRTAVIAKLVRQIIYVKGTQNNPDLNVNPIALPTYMPLRIPSPTPVLTPIPTSAALTPTPTPEIKALLNLLNDAGFESGVADKWTENGDSQFAAIVENNSKTGLYSLSSAIPTGTSAAVYLDVTALMIEKGPGRYSVQGYMKSQAIQSDACALLILTVDETPQATTDNPEPTIVQKDYSYFSTLNINIPDEWTLTGGIDQFLTNPDGLDIIDWPDGKLLRAVLVFRTQAKDELTGNDVTADFFLDDVGLYHEGTLEP